MSSPSRVALRLFAGTIVLSLGGCAAAIPLAQMAMAPTGPAVSLPCAQNVSPTKSPGCDQAPMSANLMGWSQTGQKMAGGQPGLK